MGGPGSARVVVVAGLSWMDRMNELAFVLSRTREPLSPDAVIANAAVRKIDLRQSTSDAVLSFDLGQGGALLVTHLDRPYPNAAAIPAGLLSPPKEDLATATSHVIVVGNGLPGSIVERDSIMYRLTAAVADTTLAVGIINHAGSIIRPDVFSALAELAVDPSTFPIELSIGITAGPLTDGRMFLLSQGMAHYGREELYVTCSTKGQGGHTLVYDIARRLISDPDLVIPTGHTIGRTNAERLTVDRIAHPEDPAATVLKLDLAN
jgi:hypothetical protein